MRDGAGLTRDLAAMKGRTAARVDSMNQQEGRVKGSDKCQEEADTHTHMSISRRIWD